MSSGGKEKLAEDDEVQQDVVYEATPYADLGYRVGSPIPEWKNGKSNSETRETEILNNTQPTEKAENILLRFGII